jgi:hypothetical protein
MFETLPRYEPLEIKSRPIFQLKITVSTLATRTQHLKVGKMASEEPKGVNVYFVIG